MSGYRYLVIARQIRNFFFNNLFFSKIIMFFSLTCVNLCKIWPNILLNMIILEKNEHDIDLSTFMQK